MDTLEMIVRELIESDTEEEWFEFKENWYDPSQLGEYISALSNVAAMMGLEKSYMVWGVNNDTHEIVGTKFNHHIDLKNEPLSHFLARQMNPYVDFSFSECFLDGKRIVVTIPFRSILEDAGEQIGQHAVHLNPIRQQIVNEMRKNPNITQKELVSLTGKSSTTIANHIAFLKKNRIIERIGQPRNGWWKVL